MNKEIEKLKEKFNLLNDAMDSYKNDKEIYLAEIFLYQNEIEMYAKEIQDFQLKSKEKFNESYCANVISSAQAIDSNAVDLGYCIEMFHTIKKEIEKTKKQMADIKLKIKNMKGKN